MQSQFGRWTVVEEVKSHTRSRRFLCSCLCGNYKVVLLDSLRSGKSKSCGCLHKEITSAMKTTHGMYYSPEYLVWNNMMRRCNNPGNISYKNYGGRGITVCDEWHDFCVFLKDMGLRPSKHHVIDRVDNNSNYEPGNCRWATRKQSNENRRNSIFVDINGVSLCLKDAAKAIGINYSTVKSRLRSGWPLDRAITK